MRLTLSLLKCPKQFRLPWGQPCAMPHLLLTGAVFAVALVVISPEPVPTWGPLPSSCPSPTRRSHHYLLMLLQGPHRANFCHSKTDISGNPLTPLSGNRQRGQSRDPLSQSFLQASGSSQHSVSPAPKLLPLPLSSQQQDPQSWATVPPPVGY